MRRRIREHQLHQLARTHGVVWTESATGDFTALVRTLREPGDVYDGGECPPPHAGQDGPYLMLTDAHGTTLLAGFPTDGCGAPHQDAVAAMDALSWQQTDERPFP